MFSACCCSWLWVLNFDSLVTPSTRCATSGPKRSSTSARLYSVSSGTSCRRAAATATGSMPELGEDLGRGDRVGDVRLARRADLARVGLDREVEGALDDVEVGLRVVAVDLGEEGGPQRCRVPGRRRLRRRGRGARSRRGPGGATRPCSRRRRERHLGVADDGLSHARSLRPCSGTFGAWPAGSCATRSGADHRQRPQEAHREVAGQLEVALGRHRRLGQADRQVRCRRRAA